MRYLRDGQLPEDRDEARKVRTRASWYSLLGDVLYKWGFTLPLLRCLSKEEANYVLREIHEGICGNPYGGRSMAHKAVRTGYYWSSMQKDAVSLTQKYDRCQRFANIPKRPAEELMPIIRP